MGYYNDISELKGRTITGVIGLEPNSEKVTFTCDDLSRWDMLHIQDCCESVVVADVVGDPADLIGTVIDAREEHGDTDPDGYANADEYRESFTWTFYVIQTNKGAVTIRWLGESNGWYGETPDFLRVDA